jgi:hypothetical protein
MNDRTTFARAEADDVALAVTACITHFKRTTGAIITVDAGRHL